MKQQARRLDKGRISDDWAATLAVLAVLALLAIVWLALTVGELVAGNSPAANPLAAILELGQGKRVWRWQSSATLIVVLAAVLATALLIRRSRGSGPRREIDVHAKTMTASGKLRGVAGRDAKKIGERLVPTDVRTAIAGAADRQRFTEHEGRPPYSDGELAAWLALHPPATAAERFTAATGRSPAGRKELADWLTDNPDLSAGGRPLAVRGLRIGTTVDGGIDVFMPWEMVGVMIAGTRMGKTAALAICAVLDALGPVIANSNKPDLYGHTRLGRERYGRIWLCDLQGIAGAPGANFWWDPLAQVARLAQARRLASFFVSAATTKGARVDSYFDGGAQELLALHMLAGACVGGDLIHVIDWLGAAEKDPTPYLILLEHKKFRAARRVKEAQELTERQRDGLYDMARRFLDVLSDDEYATLVTPPARIDITLRGNDVVVTTEPATHDLPEFDPVAFVTSSDTIYPLSRKGPDSAAPLTTALIGQILDAGSNEAVRHATGRLRVPMLPVLDEVANTCKLNELADQYSYLGGQGINVLSILQSRKQGARVWGADEFAEMLDQAVHVYGGNVGDIGYLEELSKLIGPHEVLAKSVSTGRGGSSTSRNWRTEPIMSVDDLSAIAKDRAIVRFPENKPILIRKIFWWDTEHADIIRASVAKYGGAVAPDDGEQDQLQLEAAPTTTATAVEP